MEPAPRDNPANWMLHLYDQPTTERIRLAYRFEGATMRTYQSVQASSETGSWTFLHAGYGEAHKGRYTFDEVISAAASWGTLVEVSPSSDYVSYKDEDNGLIHLNCES